MDDPIIGVHSVYFPAPRFVPSFSSSCVFQVLHFLHKRRQGVQGQYPLPKMPQTIFLTQNAPNFFIFLPRTLLGRLTSAAIQGSGLRNPPKRSASSKTVSGYAYHFPLATVDTTKTALRDSGDALWMRRRGRQTRAPANSVEIWTCSDH